METKTIEQVELKGKRVLMRVDFNVPLQDGTVRDDTRIRAALPSIKKVIDAGGKLILMSHLGRPKGQRKPEFSLKPAAAHLGEILKMPVALAPDCIGSETEEMVAAMKPGDVIVLENVRFHHEETENDKGFSKQLAAFGDVFINDAFGSAHRAHASTEGVTHFIDECAAGYLLNTELQALGNLLGTPGRPFVAILGGAKISGKIDVIQNLIPKVDTILVGGGMVYTFLKAQGIDVGNSLVEDDRIEMATEILEAARSANTTIKLPVDHIIATSLDAAQGDVTTSQAIPSGSLGVDLGPETNKDFSDTIHDSKTILWNGPMGVFENDAFAKGTLHIANAVAAATKQGAFSVAGGGDSVAALVKARMTSKISHVSTGGGASLEFMAGKQLPGVAALARE